MGQWSVLTEAVGEPETDQLDPHAGCVDELIELLDDHGGSVAAARRRYSARLEVEAGGVLDACRAAVDVFDRARKRAGMPAWPVVHLEAVTAEQLQRELERRLPPRDVTP